MGPLHEDTSIFMVISQLILLRIRNVSNSVEKINTNFMFNSFFRKLCRLRGNVESIVESDRSQMAIWRMQCMLDN